MTRRSIFKSLALLLGGWSAGLGRPSSPFQISDIKSEIPQPPELSPWLREWIERPMHPIVESDDPLERRLLAHQFAHTPLAVFYARSSDFPDEPRLITPILLFEKESSDGTYLLAWCHRRQAPRHFKTDHLRPV